MCIICIELQKDKMTSFEARRNIIEIEAELSKEHRLEVLKNIWEKEEREKQAKEAEFQKLYEWFINNED
tara:strand:+ start:559 stop:765 length:207 start_codon:yes stop_codon:yes gene_type:complete